MVSEPIGIQVDPQGRFRNALKEASAECNDLTVPLMRIAKEWFKGNKAIFKLKGPGKYKDLSGEHVKLDLHGRGKRHAQAVAISGYKFQKQKRWGHIYPILKASGALEKSITDPTDSMAIANIINKQVLFVGSKLKYAEWQQTGTKRGLPSRPYVLIGAEQTGPDEFNKRFEAFGAILKSYVDQKLRQKLNAR